MNYDVDESHKNYIAWKKCDIIEYLLYHSIDMKFKNRPNQLILIEVRLVSSSGMGVPCRELEMVYILI